MFMVLSSSQSHWNNETLGFFEERRPIQQQEEEQQQQDELWYSHRNRQIQVPIRRVKCIGVIGFILDGEIRMEAVYGTLAEKNINDNNAEILPIVRAIIEPNERHWLQRRLVQWSSIAIVIA